MRDRKRAKHRRAERAERRADRWELELSQARTQAEQLTTAYRWCLAELVHDRKNAGRFGRANTTRFQPAVEALVHAARGGHIP